MVSQAFITNTVTVVVLVTLVATGVMPKKLKYAINATILATLGMVPILHALNVISFTFGDAGIIKYVIAAVAVYAGQNLIAGGIKEEHALRWISIIFGIIIMVFSVVPSLYQLGALTFTLPQYPPIINSILYTLSGMLLFVCVFLSKE